MTNSRFTASLSCRLDVAMAENFKDMTRSYCGKLTEQGNVCVNGKTITKSGYKLAAGDVVEVSLPAPQPIDAQPEDILLDIVYEDNDIIVVNKPRGMVVHPAPGNTSGTLVNALLMHCKDGLSTINGKMRPGIVHRIDKDTTGLLLVAKSTAAHLGLSEQIKEHSLTRCYVALVHRNIKEDEGTITTMIGRHPTDRKKMSINCRGGREAITHFQVLKRYKWYTLVKCRLETGRTHQIRVHMSSRGNPVVGDKLYGIKKEKFTLEGQLLHAQIVGFVHPIKGEYMEFSSDIPADFYHVLDVLDSIEGGATGGK
ncbi:MAG: RluA family pseudouridine synthase [Eubacteriales bacterium]|nr:RluA family pseudouridine synthase [Eubacteriales bacterium]